ncbi:helix-turn-helix transcriptional regulator [Paenibacillus filicis]|uniref:Helix-turn-helix transcriptional regulator n=1 Tax=Paenibacillus gyeongsangnamensis TaxID=3388067 RepID=A0ABT4QA86_9BACL|nr:helix-turn-helix transcriptional regulator [Paenibacillus filicis]MCZ8513798.1 helix-turn-helix transcriptional regulator [Paenibacillus filicis]
MPIKNKLRLIMAERRINNISDLMSITGLSRNALNKLWHDEDLESVKLGTLIQVCNALGVALSELIEYENEKDGSQ